MTKTLSFLCALSLAGGCALSRRAAPAEPTPPASPPDAQPADPDKNGDPSTQPQFPPVAQPRPWSLYTTAANGVGSNVHFDQENIGSYGAVLALGARYDGKDFAARYEAAGHSYTNSNRWDRVSHFMSMSYEFGLPGNWDLETIGQVAFKGSSEDRDIVDQDVEISPRLEYQLTPQKRLRFFTVHRYKRYENAPLTNAFKNYAGLEYRHLFAPRYFVEVGGRFETNDERLNRGDYRRWSYWVEHGVPLTTRDALIMQVRYRLKRYSNRFVEVEDEDVLRVDHRWVPSISWMHTFATNVDLRIDYLYETNYSNDFEKEYGAHLLWFTIGYRWQK